MKIDIVGVGEVLSVEESTDFETAVYRHCTSGYGHVPAAILDDLILTMKAHGVEVEIGKDCRKGEW